jgi:hypothetical protein
VLFPPILSGTSRLAWSVLSTFGSFFATQSVISSTGIRTKRPILIKGISLLETILSIVLLDNDSCSDASLIDHSVFLFLSFFMKSKPNIV